MLEKPSIEDQTLIDCLQQYGLAGITLTFLPWGADHDSAVYQATGDTGARYLVKLRRGTFNDMTLMVPHLLARAGNASVIAPLPTHTGQLFTPVEGFMLALFPFIDGRNAFEATLSDPQWLRFGQTLKSLHMTILPDAMQARLPQEYYAATWRKRVKDFQQRVTTTAFDDPIAARLAALIRSQQTRITQLVARAEALVGSLQTGSLPRVLCHGDIHAGNLLLSDEEQVYVVDWDTLCFAPKEHDLMFIGAGIGNTWLTAQEEALFYQGYGATLIDPIALTYYRYERIVQDIAVYCEDILFSSQSDADRAEGLRQLTGQFLPGSVVEIAFRTDEKLLGHPR